MKVSYAVQVFSRRVSKSLEFCREILKLKEFQNSKATQEFVLIMNDIFDVFNSHCKYSNGFYSLKNAISNENVQIRQQTLDHAETYIRQLQSVDGKIIVKEDSRKTGFLGILSNIDALRCLYSDIVLDGPLSYLCTYKLSQDPLEHFFGLVRVRFGSNNNPTPYQFKSVYKRLLIGISDKLVKYGNVNLLDSDNLIALIPTAEDRINYVLEYYDCDEFEFDDVSSVCHSEFKSHVLDYISGYVVKKLFSKISCHLCRSSLKSEQRDGLIKTFDLGQYMVYPSKFVYKVVEVTEKIIAADLENGYLGKKYSFDFIVLKASNCFVTLHHDLLKKMDNHSYDLMKKIVECYASIRFKSHARMTNTNLKKNKIRSKMTKLVLYKNQ